jgi:hypothetical protein
MKRSMFIAAVVAALTLSLASRADDKTQAGDQQKTGQGQQKGSPSKGNQPSQGVGPTVVTITTVTVAEKEGCWARIHSDENFRGDTLTLVDGQSLPDLQLGFLGDWEGKVDSVEVGPKAKLTLYKDENFSSQKRELEPNAKVAELKKSVLPESFESLKLTCTK